MAVPPSKTPLFCSGAFAGIKTQPLISSAHYEHLSLSHSSCDGKARLAPSLKAPLSSPVRSPSPEPCPRTPTANPLPLIVRCSRQIPSSRGPHNPPSLSAPWLRQSTHSPTGLRSAPAFKVGTPILSGGHSFGRREAPSPGTPLTPSARPGSIRPLFGCLRETSSSRCPLAGC